MLCLINKKNIIFLLFNLNYYFCDQARFMAYLLIACCFFFSLKNKIMTFYSHLGVSLKTLNLKKLNKFKNFMTPLFVKRKFNFLVVSNCKFDCHFIE